MSRDTARRCGTLLSFFFGGLLFLKTFLNFLPLFGSSCVSNIVFFYLTPPGLLNQHSFVCLMQQFLVHTFRIVFPFVLSYLH